MRFPQGHSNADGELELVDAAAQNRLVRDHGFWAYTHKDYCMTLSAVMLAEAKGGFHINSHTNISVHTMSVKLVMGGDGQGGPLVIWVDTTNDDITQGGFETAGMERCEAALLSMRLLRNCGGGCCGCGRGRGVCP